METGSNNYSSTSLTLGSSYGNVIPGSFVQSTNASTGPFTTSPRNLSYTIPTGVVGIAPNDIVNIYTKNPGAGGVLLTVLAKVNSYNSVTGQLSVTINQVIDTQDTYEGVWIEIPSVSGLYPTAQSLTIPVAFTTPVTQTFNLTSPLSFDPYGYLVNLYDTGSNLIAVGKVSNHNTSTPNIDIVQYYQAGVATIIVWNLDIYTQSSFIFDNMSTMVKGDILYFGKGIETIGLSANTPYIIANNVVGDGYVNLGVVGELTSSYVSTPLTGANGDKVSVWKSWESAIDLSAASLNATNNSILITDSNILSVGVLVNFNAATAASIFTGSAASATLFKVSAILANNWVQFQYLDVSGNFYTAAVNPAFAPASEVWGYIRNITRLNSIKLTDVSNIAVGDIGSH
jgi:hypothetical protein